MKKVLILSQCFLFVFLMSCKEEVKEIKQTKIEFQKEGELIIYSKQDSIFKQIKNLDIELAEDEYEQQTGLMHRTSIKNNQGMLFIFDNNEVRSFYMKNTLIPLDIIFVNDQNYIVSFQKNTQPLNEQSLPSEVPAKYVLEINTGLVDQWKLKAGDSISFNKQ
ncbi:DUF192 domain-containing protein [Aquimarina sp. ERC-38]|uniref:DUF192 domain-containing protein n=1 Tax=Aquimarina sp. ERC-38 TaxID=2949996 RepID=UPI002246E275|nr:DUF192 domain-containing protein [Aquimarina sp. ERC-38]UZO80835.1 DUF192 domain-containing protein [Aquimarina sp. ERC-38]